MLVLYSESDRDPSYLLRLCIFSSQSDLIMDDFANILQRDYGLRPQGKSAPMSVRPSAPSPFSSSAPSSTPAPIQRTSSAGKPKNGSNRNSKNATSILGDSLDEDYFFGSSNGINSTSSGRNTFGSAASDIPVMYDDVFGGPPKFATPSYPPMPSSATQQNSSSQSYDDIFRMPVKPSSSTSASSNNASTFPVFDAPLYDDDIFGGVPGIRSGSVVYDDVFSGGSTVGTSPSVLEDLLGVSESRDRSSGLQQPAFDSSIPSGGLGEFDELLPGFGGIEPAKPRPTGAGKFSQHNSSGLDKDSHGMSPSDPFDVLHVDDSFNVPQSAGEASAPPFPDSDSLKVPYQPSGSDRRRYSNSDYEENIDASGNSSPHVSTAQSPSRESRYPSKSKNSLNSAQSYASVLEENHAKRNQSSSNQAEEQTRSSSSPKPQYAERAEAPSFHSPIRRTRQVYDDFEEPVRIPKVVENRQADEFWISVEDVKLVTEPTAAPPPSRRPPLPGLKHGHTTRKVAGSKAESNSRHESPQATKLSSSRGPSEHSNRPTFNNAGNMYDELEEFASGVSRARKETKMDMSANTVQEDIMEGSAAVSASAMAMKEAMERARSKLRDREKEDKESGVRVEEAQEDLNEVKEDEEEKARELEEKERAREREEREREAKALREREEREKRRREREKEKEREREREREKDRIAVERATQEARERAERAAVERATAEARERAAAEARQRVAVERVTAEARERAAAEARAAVERATAEARERAAAEARERAAAEARERAAVEARERTAAEARERAAAEAREKVASEARIRAERAFVERVNAEARERAAERAAADARERAERAATERAAAEKEKQRRSENDLEALFGSSSRPGSVPRQRSPAKGTSSDGRQPSKGFPAEGLQRNAASASAVRKVTPTSSADDWTSLFGPAVPAAGEFQEIEGESAERRRARWDRQQRTAERAAKALDAKNQRDLQSQREQAERHRAGDMLDAEIKRWAAGKEGNLRALLSTLQYVLWPECGWQAVSLTDLITAAAVKKVYRKATLCVHPDKVQQKGATIQQKYIAEKVFDLLKEAWNKFNAEELF